MLKKLTATGIVAAAAAGVMSLSGPANADSLSANRTTVAHPGNDCHYVPPGHYRPAWCEDESPNTGYDTYNPGYYNGWDRDRWHRWNQWNRYQFHPYR